TLEASNKQNEITSWLMWFAGVAIEAQRRTIAMVEFLIDKTKLLDCLKEQLNERQEKALLRMFREGPEGFRGGLTAGKYSTVTGACRIASRTYFFYRFVEGCLQLRIFASLVTNAVASASAVAPIRRSHGSLE